MVLVLVHVVFSFNVVSLAFFVVVLVPQIFFRIFLLRLLTYPPAQPSPSPLLHLFILLFLCVRACVRARVCVLCVCVCVCVCVVCFES